MKTGNLLLTTAMLFAFLTGTAAAEPKNGFGLNAGLASHTRDCNGCAGSSTFGPSFGMDLQRALPNTPLSISLFVMGSGEFVSNDASETTIGHSIFGVQLRYWAGDMFFGGHLGRYGETLTTGGVSSIGLGGGAGLVAGWEKPDGGLYVMGQLDSATVKYSGFSDVKFSAVCLSVGYRWK